MPGVKTMCENNVLAAIIQFFLQDLSSLSAHGYCRHSVMVIV